MSENVGPELPVGRMSIEVYTSPHATADLDPEPALLSLIDSAKTSILVGAYSFTLAPLAQALIAKHNAGVTIRIAADAGEYANAKSQWPVLKAAGLDIHVWGSRYDLQHMKVIVVDGKRCAWGSYNFSSGAENGNYEVLTIATSTKLANVFTAQIELAYDKGKAAP